MLQWDSVTLGVIGLGYVGLPLAVEFGKRLNTVGYDINEQRVAELQRGKDSTLEVEQPDLQTAEKLSYSSQKEDILHCNVYIVTVPTPITQHRQPDLTPLQSASKLLGEVVDKGDIVIFESTVYPGCTEEVCIPIIEAVSGLRYNHDFFAGLQS